VLALTKLVYNIVKPFVIHATHNEAFFPFMLNYFTILLTIVKANSNLKPPFRFRRDSCYDWL